MNSPITGEEMPVVQRQTTITFRKEDFTVLYPSYYCSDSGEYFTTTAFDTIKMKQVYNQYRDKYNIPFPEEIIEIRKKYGLSAKRMSEILGFGVNSYRNYENGEVPNQSNAKLIQMASDPSQMKKLVNKSPLFLVDDEFDEHHNDEGQKLIKIIEERITERRQERFQLGLEKYLLGSDLPDRFTGYIKPTIEKLKEMVVFFAEKLEPTTTQLNKLLFYADFLHYRDTANSISGTRYRAIQNGPVPNNYESIFEFMASKGAINIKTSEFEWGYKKEFLPSKAFDSSLFEKEELETLEQVWSLFKNLSTSEIVEQSHLEDAWLDNYDSGKNLIDYTYAFKLRV